MKRRGREDPVSPDVVRHVYARDQGCVLAFLADQGRIVLPTPCRDRGGSPFDGRFVPVYARPVLLTLAHVRDRAGGRMGKRPPSTPRRLAAVCAGHALPPDNMVDRAEIRPVVDDYLAELEGADLDESRPWERVRRVRARAVDSATSEDKGGLGRMGGPG